MQRRSELEQLASELETLRDRAAALDQPVLAYFLEMATLELSAKVEAEMQQSVREL